MAEKDLASNGRYSFNAANITAEVSGNGILAKLSGGETLTCDLKRDIKRNHGEKISEEYYKNSSDLVCYFIRTLNHPWTSNSHCLNIAARLDGKANRENSATIIISVVVLACAVALTGIISLAWYFKNCLQKITFKMPIVYNNVEETEANNAQPMNEIVDEITFSASNQDHTGPEGGALDVKKTDGLSLNIEGEEATPLCHEDLSAGQSKPESEFSEASNKTLNESGIQSPYSTSGFTKHEDMMNNGYVDKDSLDRSICKTTFPQYVTKDSLQNTLNLKPDSATKSF